MVRLRDCGTPKLPAFKTPKRTCTLRGKGVAALLGFELVAMWEMGTCCSVRFYNLRVVHGMEVSSTSYNRVVKFTARP